MAEFRLAAPGDVESLTALMREFYAESGFPADPESSARAFRELIGTAAFGRIWIVEEAGTPVGYLVLTLGYSMEYEGRDAFVDDLFLRPSARGRGLGARLLDLALETAAGLDVRAVHLEVDRANAVARRLYASRGFLDHDRMLLTRKL